MEKSGKKYVEKSSNTLGGKSGS